MYILSQIAATASTIILLVYSVMNVKRNTILICNIIINSLLAVHYLLLVNYTGALCSGVTAFMVYVFYYKNRLNNLVPTGFTILFLICGARTWQDWWSVIPVMGNILLVIALWNDNENIIKGIFIIVGLLWIILNIHLKSAANVIGQILAVSGNIIYFIRKRRC